MGNLVGQVAGYVVGSILGALLFPAQAEKQRPKLGQIKLTGPARGTPVPILFGTELAEGNLIWASPVTVHEPPSKKGGAGKGTVLSKGSDEATTYSRSCVFLIGEGDPAMVLFRILNGDKVLYDRDDPKKQQKSGIDFTFYKGTADQAVDPRIAAYQQGGSSTGKTKVESVTINGAAPTYTVAKPPVVAGSDTIIGTTGVGDDAQVINFTRVGSGPAQNQYTIDTTTGLITFGGTYANLRVTITYKHSSGTSKQEPLAYPYTCYCYIHELNLGPSPAPPPTLKFEIGRGTANAAPLYVQKTTASAGSPATGVTVPKPPLTRAGSFLLGSFHFSAQVPAIIAPAGWTVVQQQGVNTFAAVWGAVAVAYKVAGDAEPADYTFSDPASSGTWFGVIELWENIDPVAPVHASAKFQDNASDGSWQTPSIVTTAKNRVVVGFVGGKAGDAPRNITPPTGYTEIYDLAPFAGPDYGSGSDMGAAAYKTEPAAGSVGPLTFSSSAPSRSAGILVALNPAPLDANPVDWIDELMTHARYGAGAAAGLVDATTKADIRTFCNNNDLLISGAIDSSGSALRHIEEVLTYYFGWLGYIQGKFLFGARRAEAAIKELVHDDSVAGTESAVTLPGVRDTKNQIRLDWTDRSRRYTSAQKYLSNDFDRQASGMRQETLSMPYCKRVELAAKIASKYLYLRSQPQMGYVKTLGPQDLALVPGDVVSLTDASLGLSQHVVRIASISEADDRGRFKIEVFEEPAAALAMVAYPSEVYLPGDVSPPDPFEEIGDTVASIVELPGELTGGAIRLAFALAGTADEWTGAAIYMSQDNQSFTKVKEYFGPPAVLGSLALALAQFPFQHYLHDLTAEVDLAASAGQLAGVTRNQMLAGRNLAIAGSEYLSFRDALLLSGARYRMTGLLRGWFDSGPLALAQHTRFIMISTDFPIMEFSKDQVGQTYYFKFASLNHVGLEQTIAGLPSYAVTLQGLARQPDPVYGLMVKEGSTLWAKVVVGPGQVDVTVGWRYAFTGNTEDADLVNGTEDGTAKEADFQDYVIKVYSKATAGGAYTLRRTVTGITTESYTYTAAQNSADAGSYQRFLKCEVQVRRKTGVMSPMKSHELEVAA